MLPHGLEQSYQRLIASGCDQRLVVGADGLNPYGSSLLPRRAVALGSCSCSSPSTRAVEAAQTALSELRRAPNVDQSLNRLRDRVRCMLRAAFSLAEEVDIVLTPSGTDVELLAAALVSGADHPLVNIVVAPEEVGRGTRLAAAGRHYSHCLPCGRSAEPGSPVNDALAGRIELRTISVRDRYGEPLLPIEIDSRVSEAAIAALQQGKKVLIHVVAHSKTGIHAPSLPVVENLTRQMPDEVFGIVDAAQGRLAPAAYQAALDRGWMVALTGSKFFGGPPFCGALLLPPSLGTAAGRMRLLPAGLDDYFCWDDLPANLFPGRQFDKPWINVGGLLRWIAATAEIDAYFHIDAVVRERISSEFATTVRQQFVASQHASLLKDFVVHDHDGAFPNIESATTVFALRLFDAEGTQLDREQLSWLHRRLNTQPAGTRYHLGQPVRIGAQSDVIRLALGAPLVIEVATNPALGICLTDRLQWMKQMLGQLAARIQETVAGVPRAGSLEASQA